MNFERTMQVALDQINDAGGAAEQPLCLVGADTHSDSEAGSRAVSSLVSSGQIDVLVGPENLAVVRSSHALLQDNRVFHVVPGVTMQQLHDGQSDLTLELGPVAERVGCAMAKHAYDDNHRKIAVVYSLDAGNSATAQAIPSSMASHQRSTSPAQVDLFPIPDGDTPPPIGVEVSELAPDAVVLLTPVAIASLILQEWPDSRTRPAWYLGPNLLSEALLRNSPEGLLEGAKGIGPSFLNKNDAEGLDRRTEALYGDRPFPVSYYYYDAAALLGLAIEAAYRGTGEPPDASEICNAIRSISTSPGTEVGWNELGEGIKRLGRGESVDYRGVSGPLTMDRRGRLQYSGEYNFDVVENGAIVFSGRENCIQ
jgi:branched-chain amino acid transport system substrate-binding protein